MTDATTSTNSPPAPFEKGLVQVFTGDGKGKTSAALGIVLRALGHGLRVCIVVFMKGNYPYGEWQALSQLPGVEVHKFGTEEFVDPHNLKPLEIEGAREGLACSRQAMLSSKFDIIVMDEVNVAAAWQLIELDDLVTLIKDRPGNVELILTGRGADKKIIELADLVTECSKVKHPYDRGILARRGLDY